jgi:hypothetical protein
LADAAGGGPAPRLGGGREGSSKRRPPSWRRECREPTRPAAALAPAAMASFVAGPHRPHDVPDQRITAYCRDHGFLQPVSVSVHLAARWCRRSSHFLRHPGLRRCRTEVRRGPGFVAPTGLSLVLGCTGGAGPASAPSRRPVVAVRRTATPSCAGLARSMVSTGRQVMSPRPSVRWVPMGEVQQRRSEDRR